MTTKMKGWVMGVLIAVAAAGCAGSNAMTQRGSVVINRGTARAFAAGPAVIHAYSQDRGGRVFAAAAESGTDADCERARPSAPSALAVDSVQIVTIAPGQIACVETDSRRSYELLWHARPATPAESAMAVAYGRK